MRTDRTFRSMLNTIQYWHVVYHTASRHMHTDAQIHTWRHWDTDTHHTQTHIHRHTNTIRFFKCLRWYTRISRNHAADFSVRTSAPNALALPTFRRYARKWHGRGGYGMCFLEFFCIIYFYILVFGILETFCVFRDFFVFLEIFFYLFLFFSFWYFWDFLCFWRLFVFFGDFFKNIY